MWSKFANSRVFSIIFSLLAAIVCWLYVDLSRTIEAKIPIYNIPVSFIGEESLADEGLLIVGETPTINIVVSGPRSVITKLNRDNVIITATVSQITEAGVYSVDCPIDLPSSITSTSDSTVHISSRSASAVDVTVVKMVSKSIPIRPEFTGSVAENRFYDENSFVLQQKELEISGEKSVVDTVSYAKVVLTETELTDTWTGWLNVILCDQEGQELSTDNLTLEADTISVAFYVECQKEVPLTVEFSSGGGATKENADYTIDPETILVSGQEVVLDNLEKISLGTVDLSQIITTGEYTFDINLPAGVSSKESIKTATVQVSITGLETRRITTNKIQLINAPEEYRFLHDDSMDIRIRGRAEDFSMLMNDDVQVTLDLSQVDLAAGTTVNVPATVEIVGISELGILGSYSMEVTVEEADTASTEDPSVFP